jgi:putative SOS response-associated peptidase YedK
MCGRYTLAVELDEIAERFGCPKVERVWKARYNVAPEDVMPVVINSGQGRRLELMHWGLVPYWSKERKSGYRMINARAETVAQKPAFREAFRHRRCLVPATGYYEWFKDGHQSRPFHIHVFSRSLFAFAGLWDEWGPGSAEHLLSYTILTTPPAPAIAYLHDRMPLVLARSDEEGWLNGGPVPTAETALEGYEVSALVNRAGNDLADCIIPVRRDNYSVWE